MRASMQSLVLVLSLLDFAKAVTYKTKYKNGHVLAAHRLDGTLITWGNAAFGAEGTRSNVDFLASTHGAFAAVLTGGALACWGDTNFAGDCSGISSTDIQSLNSVSRMDDPSAGSFAGLDSNGQVFNWGAISAGGYNADVAPLLTSGVLSLEQCGEGFVAVKPNEVLVPWSYDDSFSGDPDYWSVVDKELATGEIDEIFGNGDAFCVLKDDKTVFCWGDPAYLGSGPSGVTDVINIFTTDFAFAAQDSSGGVTAWGDASSGGDASAATLTDVVFVVSTSRAFAALINDGTVETWGFNDYGGTGAGALTDIIAIFGSHTGFAAVDSTGAVFVWGENSSPPGGMDPIFDIVTSKNAFAALSYTGNVYVWGDANEINTSGATDTILASGTVTSIYATDEAFAAIYGSSQNVVCWGDSAEGGDCTALSSELYDISYIYGNEIRRVATFRAPTISPTAQPTTQSPTVVPTSAPRRPTVSPTISQDPTKAPLGFPFATEDPTPVPSSLPTGSVDPVVSGNVNNMTYYCRPKNYISGRNGKTSYIVATVI